MKSFDTHLERLDACQELMQLAGYLVCEGYRQANWYVDEEPEIRCVLHYYESRKVMNQDCEIESTGRPYYYMFMNLPEAAGRDEVVLSFDWDEDNARVIQAHSKNRTFAWDQAMAFADEALRAEITRRRERLGSASLLSDGVSPQAPQPDPPQSPESLSA